MLRQAPEGAPQGGAEPPSRPGVAIEPARLWLAVSGARRTLAVAVIIAGTVGALVGKLLVPKSYAASAMVLWQPAAEAKTDPVRELVTLSDSVKLPSNLRRVREKLSLRDDVEALGKRVEVSLGDNSMLLTVKAKGATRDDAAALANATVDVFLDAQREVSAQRRREIAEALRASLAIAEASLSDAQSRYDAFRALHHVGDMSLEVQAAIEELAKLRVARDEARVELEAMRGRESALVEAKAKAPADVELSRTEQRPDVAKLADVETELVRARAGRTSEHPVVQALDAEAKALRQKTATDPSAVTARTLGRNGVRDALAVQAQESSALRRSIEQKASALARVELEAAERATKLTLVEGEAARLLADVKTSHEHVAALLKQLAAADDDVRTAVSGFQVVSEAAPPERSEKGMGKVVAVALPLLAALSIVVYAIARELGLGRLRSGREIAYWTGLPVLWTSGWSGGAGQQAERVELGRELSAALDGRFKVLCVAGLDGASPVGEVAEELSARLERRGRRCAVVELRAPDVRGGGDDLVDALEHAAVSGAITMLSSMNDLVLLVCPSLSLRDAHRAAVRLGEAMLLVVGDGQLTVPSSNELARSLSVADGKAFVVVTGVDTRLLPAWTRRVGASPGPVVHAPVARVASAQPAKKRAAKPRGQRVAGPRVSPSPAE